MNNNYLKAVLEIAQSSPQLRHDLLPIIDQEKQEIHWEKLEYGALSGGVQTAIAWAKALWTDEVDSNMRGLFDAFGSLDVTVQRAILRAMAVRYGL